MDKFSLPHMSVWQGRQDPEDGELALRWHDKVQDWPLSGTAEPGVALLGFACDEGVRRNKGRVGAAGAPLAIRKLLANSAWHLTRPVYDSGDLTCDDGDLDAAHARLAERVASLLDEGHFPLVMGGGHEVAFGSWSGLNRHLVGQGRVGIINFDAHFDLRRQVEQGWDCLVLDHYGSTESAFAGAVQCRCREGRHVRALDLLLEIVHPVTGKVLPAGETGELVITTLQRRAMPLLRYRTGDMASLLDGPCACGSPLPRLGPVLGRIEYAGQGFRVTHPRKGGSEERRSCTITL